MCAGPLAPSKPKPQPLPPPPTPPAPAPQRSDPAVSRARKKDKQQAALAGGRKSTVLTGGSGLTGSANGAKKTLLGA